MGSGVESVAYMFLIHEESVKAKIVIYGAVWTAIQWDKWLINHLNAYLGVALSLNKVQTTLIGLFNSRTECTLLSACWDKWTFFEKGFFSDETLLKLTEAWFIGAATKFIVTSQRIALISGQTLIRKINSMFTCLAWKLLMRRKPRIEICVKCKRM